MELSEQMRERSLELQLNWVPRDQNVLADSITNEDFSSFSASKRIFLDPANIGWKILDKAMLWSKQVYDETTTAKAENKRKREATGQEGLRRRFTRASKRLRATDPW